MVYCMDRCWNNIGGWATKRISHPASQRDFAHYAAKDKAMADDAKMRMMLWDGESKGTLNNIQNLLAAGKKALVYFSPDNTFYKLATRDDLTALVSRCDLELIAAAQRRIEKVLRRDSLGCNGVLASLWTKSARSRQRRSIRLPLR